MRMPPAPRKLNPWSAAAALWLVAVRTAEAHASQQGLVLLLPTDLYIVSGVAAVALTVAVLAFAPGRLVLRLFRPRVGPRLGVPPLRALASGLSAGLLALLIWAGLAGPADPLANPLPLIIWTVLWIGLVTLQALLGDIWAWINPWSGTLYLARSLGWRAPARLPGPVMQWAGVAGVLGFAYLLLADPAPADPARLARIVTLYWLATLALGLIFGRRWLRRGEAVGQIMSAYARLAIPARRAGRVCLGVPGWRILARAAPPLPAAVLAVLLLGTGSFDGLNETFWWYGLNGINPFEYPGRSDLVLPNLAGLVVSNVLLLGTVALLVAAGLRLARSDIARGLGFRLFAPAILPIALGYHIAHYLPSFLVDGQYALVALSDPFLRGDDWLGLGAHYVTTGFFNTPATVRLIFLTQAGAVVIGHVLAIMLAHAIALRHLGDTRRAALSQAPLALFMIAYTLFGLWLLAAPRL